MIKDLCEIKFSTKLLFITQKDNYNKMYEKYIFILDDKEQTISKMSFSDNLKRNFREKILNGAYALAKSICYIPVHLISFIVWSFVYIVLCIIASALKPFI